MTDFPHDIAKELIQWVLTVVCTWLGGKVARFAKDVNCLFNRVRALEERVGINNKGEHECKTSSSDSR